MSTMEVMLRRARIREDGEISVFMIKLLLLVVVLEEVLVVVIRGRSRRKEGHFMANHDKTKIEKEKRERGEK